MRAKIIACDVMEQEIQSCLDESILRDNIPCEFLEAGLHRVPKRLLAELQTAIDNTQGDIDTILLGFGMCSQAATGVYARRFRLVMPKVDDCIPLFLGSRGEYIRQQSATPGTFYLTRGWNESGLDPYGEYLKTAEKYGPEKAYRLTKRILESYTRLAFIDTGTSNTDDCRQYARQSAEFFDLSFEEIPGCTTLITRLVTGDWRDDFIIVEPGAQLDAGALMR